MVPVKPHGFRIRFSRTWQSSLDGQANRQYGHENFIRHWINNRPYNCSAVPSPRYPSVNQIWKSSICQQAYSPGIRILQYKVSYDWACSNSCHSKEIRYCVYVLVDRRIGFRFLCHLFICVATCLVAESLDNARIVRCRQATREELTTQSVFQMQIAGDWISYIYM